MKIAYDIVEIIGRDGLFDVLLMTSPSGETLASATTLRKSIEIAQTPDTHSPRVKAALLAIQKLCQELGWDEAKIQAALPPNP